MPKRQNYIVLSGRVGWTAYRNGEPVSESFDEGETFSPPTGLKRADGTPFVFDADKRLLAKGMYREVE